MTGRARVVTVSTRAAGGVYADDAGPAVATVLTDAGFEVAGVTVVPDGLAEVAAAIIAACADADLVVTNGGTGCTPRDVTPEATRDVIERDAPGLAELLRARGRDHTPMAVLSRGVAGVVGSCLVVNLPGSPAAVREGLKALLPVLPHALAVLEGDTEHR